LTGKVELVYGKSNIRIALLEKTKTFGALAFFMEAPRATAAKSMDFTTLFELPRELFVEKLKDFPADNVSFSLEKKYFSNNE